MPAPSIDISRSAWLVNHLKITDSLQPLAIKLYILLDESENNNEAIREGGQHLSELTDFELFRKRTLSCNFITYLYFRYLWRVYFEQ